MPQPPYPPSTYHLTLNPSSLTILRSLTGLNPVQESECIRYLEGVVADDFTPGETEQAEAALALIKGLNDLIEKTQKDVAAHLQARFDDDKDAGDIGEVLDRIDVGEGVKVVMFGDPELAGGICLGEFYVHPDDEDVIYTSCPLCGCDSGIYGGNRWYTQACCYLHIREEDVSLNVERWVTEHLLAGESIDEVHAQLTALRTHPPLRSYVERINAILNDERTAAAYKKYLVRGDRTGSDPEADFEKAADAAECQTMQWKES